MTNSGQLIGTVRQLSGLDIGRPTPAQSTRGGIRSEKEVNDMTRETSDLVIHVVSIKPTGGARAIAQVTPTPPVLTMKENLQIGNVVPREERGATSKAGKVHLIARPTPLTGAAQKARIIPTPTTVGESLATGPSPIATPIRGPTSN
jgi:hypothetical protein